MTHRRDAPERPGGRRARRPVVVMRPAHGATPRMGPRVPRMGPRREGAGSLPARPSGRPASPTDPPPRTSRLPASRRTRLPEDPPASPLPLGLRFSEEQQCVSTGVAPFPQGRERGPAVDRERGPQVVAMFADKGAVPARVPEDQQHLVHMAVALFER